MADGATAGGGDLGAGRGADPGAYLYPILMVLIGSTTAPAAKYIVREVPVGLIPLIRFGVAGMLLLPVVWRSDAFRRMIRVDAARLAVTAACCVPINQAFFLNGTRLAPTTHVALIYAACPLVVLALASAIGQERLTAGRLVGVILSVAGLVIIALGNLGDATAAGRDVLVGDLILIGAVASWGAYLTVSKPLIARYGSLPALAGTFLVGAALDLPVAAWSASSWTSLSAVSPTVWAALAYMTLVITVLGLLFQNLAMDRLDASQVATFGNLAPLLTMAWGYLLFGERLTAGLAVGGGLILLGLFGTSRPSGRPAPAPAPAPSAVGDGDGREGPVVLGVSGGDGSR